MAKMDNGIGMMKSQMHKQEKATKSMGKANPSMAFPKGGSYSASFPLGRGNKAYCPKLDTSKKFV